MDKSRQLQQVHSCRRQSTTDNPDNSNGTMSSSGLMKNSGLMSSGLTRTDDTAQGATSFYSSCREQRPSFLEESLGRFISPLAISYVRIPANVWPGNMIGDESTGTLLSNERTVRSSTRDNFDTTFVEQFALLLTRSSPLFETTSTSASPRQRVKNRSLAVVVSSSGSLPACNKTDSATGTATALQLLHRHVSIATNDRVNHVALRKLTIDQANVEERNDSCIASAYELCTFRISDATRNAANVTVFCQMARNVRESAIDIKQCQTLLRKTIRACNQTCESTPVPDFDKGQAVNEIMANGGIDFLLKEYVAFISALQTRKWLNMVNVKVLTIKLHDLEQEKTKTAQRLNETVAKETYARLSERLQNEQTSAQHVTSQLAMMRKLINATRYNLNQLYAHLFGRWNELSESTRRSMDMFRAFNLHPPDVVGANFQRDVYVLDLFKTFEVARSTNTFLLKYVEDKYDFVYDLFSPVYLRPVNANGPPNNGNRNYAAQNDNERYAEKLRAQTIESINYFRNKLLETRTNYRESRYHMAATDVRHLILAYQRFVKHRTEYLMHLVSERVNLDSLELEPISEHSVRQRVRDKLKSISTNDVDRKVGNWFNDQEMEMCIEILNLNFDRGKRSIRGQQRRRGRDGGQTLPEANEDYYDNDKDNDEEDDDDDDDDNEHEGSADTAFDYKCRPIGDTLLMLRELQDVYDYAYMARTLDRQLDRLLVQRYQIGANRVNTDSEYAKWDDRRIAEELENNIRSTFNETLGTWDRLVQRVSTIEQQANSDMNSWNGGVTRNEISERINCWLYRNYDDFNFTVLHAKFTMLDSNDEIRTVLKNFSYFAYLLSWLLEMRAFVPTNYRARTSSPPESETEISSSDEEEPTRKAPRTVNILNAIRADEHVLQEQPTYAIGDTYNRVGEQAVDRSQTAKEKEQDNTTEMPESEMQREEGNEVTMDDDGENLGAETLPTAPTVAEILNDESRKEEPTLDDLLGPEEATKILRQTSSLRRIEPIQTQNNTQRIEGDVVNVNNLNLNRDRRFLDARDREVPMVKNDKQDRNNDDDNDRTGDNAYNNSSGENLFQSTVKNNDEVEVATATTAARNRDRRGGTTLKRRRTEDTRDVDGDDDDFDNDEYRQWKRRRPTDNLNDERALLANDFDANDFDEDEEMPMSAMTEESKRGRRSQQPQQQRRVPTGKSTYRGPRRTRDPANDALRGSSRPTIARPRRNVNQGLQRLRRIADNAPSEIGVGLLNNAYRNEMRKKNTIRSRIRRNLSILRDKIGIPEFKFVRID